MWPAIILASKRHCRIHRKSQATKKRMQKMINNLKNTNVSDGYQLGLSDRKEIPFIAGSEYKIKEFRGRLERKQKVLVKIGDAVRKKEMPHCFGPCMGFEAAAWCKSLPALTAYQLGHDFVGALHALTGDGIPESTVDELRQNVNRAIPSLLQLGEIARTELKKSWVTTGPDLGGRSTLDLFIADCIRLVDQVLIIVAKHKRVVTVAKHKRLNHASTT
jgi:hypothetical protein